MSCERGCCATQAEHYRSVSVKGSLSADRAKPVEGKAHPDSGLPFVSRTDDNGATVTEHTQPGSGVSVRQDVNIRPDVVRVNFSVNGDK